MHTTVVTFALQHGRLGLLGVLLLLYSPMPEIPPVRAHLPEEPRILKTRKRQKQN